MGLTRTAAFARSVTDPTSGLCTTGYAGGDSSDPSVTADGQDAGGLRDDPGGDGRPAESTESGGGRVVRITRRVRTELGESTGTFRELFITRGPSVSVDAALHPQTDGHGAR